jgi:hypothetical protein
MESYTLARFGTFRKGLQDMARAEVRNDALVLLGDNTMNAQITEYTMFYAHLEAFNQAKNTLVAMGNHDINESKNTAAEAIARHNRFYNGYTGAKNDKAYYAREFGGYWFILLGSEGEAGTNAYLSQAQLNWLGDTMGQAAASGKPIFVFCHQQLNGLPGNLWGAGGGIGVQSDAVYAILNAYQNVYLFNGHLHNGIARQGVFQQGNLTLIDLPAFTGEEDGGCGYSVEVYADKVLLRARNFAEGTWLSTLEFAVPVV